MEAIVAAVSSFADLAERGRPGPERFRELPVSFGRHGYVIRYWVEDDVVFVTRSFHSREAR